jgi:hypothetical protein
LVTLAQIALASTALNFQIVLDKGGKIWFNISNMMRIDRKKAGSCWWWPVD